MMGAKGRKRWRFVIGILKDRASLIKSSLFTKRKTSTIIIAVIRATTHDPLSPPSDKRVDAVLSFGHGSRATACACIEALMDRLHSTHNAFVALKCLVVLHHILMRGSFILKDQLSIYPSAGGHNFLNLSTFRDDSDADTWEVSSWVRWYAGVVEQNMIVSRFLGFFLSLSSRNVSSKDKEEKVSGISNSDLLREVDALAGFVEQVCGSPESYHLRKNDLVNEVVRLAAENYGLIQREMSCRVKECDGRMDGLSQTELTQFLDALKRLEGYRERLLLLFVNRKRNDALWDLIRETKIKMASEKEKREERRLVVVGRRRGESNELTRFRERVSGSPQLFRFNSQGGAWLDVDRVHLTVSAVG